MKKIIKRMVDGTERLLYGATAEEAVARRIALIDQRVDAALTRLADRLEAADAAEEEKAKQDERSAAAE